MLGPAPPLQGLWRLNLFDALVALRLPAVAPENVHLEVALAAQRLAQQDTIDIITHVYAQIVHKDYYMQEEDDRTLALLDHRATLDTLFRSMLSSPPTPLLLTRRLVTRRTRA